MLPIFRNTSDSGLSGVFWVLFATPHRFSFNGKGSDSEVKGEGNSLDFGARLYDSRLGRWMTIDQCAKEYPFVSSYSNVLNNPLNYIDVDGRRIEIAGNANPETLTKLINTVFGGKLVAKIVVNNVNKSYLEVHFPDGVSMTDLSNEQKFVYALLSAMIAANKTYKLKVEEDAGGNTDEYSTSKIYPKNFNTSYSGPYNALYQFDHALREQKVLQVKKNKFEELTEEDKTYYQDHQKTKDQASFGFGYHFCNEMSTPDGNIRDIDIVENSNVYVATVRIDTRSPGLPKIESYIKLGVNPGSIINTSLDKVGPGEKYGDVIERNEQHFNDNPIDE